MTAVQIGTGANAKIPGVEVGGKTGTAQSDPKRKPFAWFTSFAPADDPAVREKVRGAPGAVELAGKARAALAEIRGPWTVEDVEAALRGAAEREGVKPKAIFQPLRVALAGTTVSPGIFETVALLGREETLARVDEALNRASTFADTAEGGR